MIHNISKSTISSWYIITSKFVARLKKKLTSKHIFFDKQHLNIYIAMQMGILH